MNAILRKHERRKQPIRRSVQSALELYLDDAYMAGLPWVRIIHGKGTGALRAAVREELKRHPLVSSFESGQTGEGGGGVTVAKLVAE